MDTADLTDRRAESPTHTARWVLPVLLPLVAVVVAHLVLDPGSWPDVLGSVVTCLLWGSSLVGCLVLAVLAILRGKAFRRSEDTVRTWTAVAVVAYLVLLTSLSGRVARLPFFETLEWNWQGKVLDLLWVAVLFGILHRWARAEAGLRWQIEPGSARPALLLIGGVFGLFAALTVVSVGTGAAPAETVSIEQLAFNGTIPNLTEELIWRCAMIAVLAPALAPLLGGSRRVFGTQVGWGVVLTSLVFGLGHMILVDAAGVWSLSIGGGIFATVMGLLLGWLWCRTRSFWPVFLLHCAPELGMDVGLLLTA